MPKYSIGQNWFKVKVSKSGNQYIVTFPKPLGDSKQKISGMFEFNPITKEIVFKPVS